jgi:hypothetical protein
MNNTITRKILFIVLGLVGIILSYYLTSLYLRNNFYDAGEAYHKGAGHLLQENFGKGVAFISLRHLMASTLLFTMFFSLVNTSSRRLSIKILTIIATAIMILVLTYACLKYFEARNYQRTADQMHIFNRTLEIVLTWTCNVLGIFMGYVITKRKKNATI